MRLYFRRIWKSTRDGEPGAEWNPQKSKMHIISCTPPIPSNNLYFSLIIGLVLHDSWLSELFTMDPIVKTDSLKLALPVESRLYRASTLHEWSRLRGEVDDTHHALDISSHGFSLPDLHGPVHVFSIYGLLCSVLLRVSADTRRMVSSSELVSVEQYQHVPWNLCRLDKRASMASPLLIRLIHDYDQTLRKSNPNCIVIWHSVCILLTVDLNVLSRAAGRNGVEPIESARQSLAKWTQTAAARRACLHAAQTFRTLSHRKHTDGTAFQSVRTLFVAALALGLYILTCSEPSMAEDTEEHSPFDLASTDIDWKVIGDEGISDPSTEPAASSNAAVTFIRFGGQIFFDGRRYQPGPRHAQRVILEFASLLDEVGTHWMADYARLLYMIHDTIT